MWEMLQKTVVLPGWLLSLVYDICNSLCGQSVLYITLNDRNYEQFTIFAELISCLPSKNCQRYVDL